MAITHMYTHVSGTIRKPTFRFVLRNKVTGKIAAK